MRRAATLTLCSLLFATPAVAQVYQCNGTWRTVPCDTPQPAASILPPAAQPTMAVQHEDPDRGTKSSMFHELTMKTIRARESYGIKTELAPVERVCIRELHPLDACAAAIKGVEEELDRKIASADQLKTQQQAVKAQEEANKLQAERNEIERNKPTVAVVRRPVIIVRPDTELRPQIGSSVQVQGSGPQGNVSISITENSGYSYPRPHGIYHNTPRAAGGQVVALPRAPKGKKQKPSGSDER